MELVLKTDSDEQVELILAFAKKLNIIVESLNASTENQESREILKQRILNFRAENSSSFGDAAKWQDEERTDRNLPFSAN
ncbi:hypothetical protein [Dyadobacter bucti]|jgi:hypothetical protein|uniref:hypothetical protein n=1 Tax=Dyadobacter bucti TaxID=2572203 RepID=UPI003F71D08E